MSIFTRYREVEKKGGALLNMDWQIMRGGYLHLGQNNWTLLHRFFVRGAAMFGQQEEFILRLQLALDEDPRFSWVTLEFVNPYEARLAYIWIKVWKNRNIRFVFNFGWRLTLESKRMLQQQVMDKERRNLRTMQRNMASVQPK